MLVKRRAIDGPEGYIHSTYRATVFHFTQNYLAAFSADYNIIDDVAVNEITNEFFYRDIVAVKTVTELSKDSQQQGKTFEASKFFKLISASGDSIDAVVSNPRQSAGSQILSRGTQAVANIRAMLKEYKIAPGQQVL